MSITLTPPRPTAIQTIALTGDVTGTGTTGIVTTIALNAVTNTQLADMAQATFKMRAAGAGTGDPIDGTAAQAKTALAIVPADVTGFDTQVRTSRLDQMAAPTASVSFNSQKITSLADGTVATDGINLGQLTAAIEGRKNKDPADWSTTGNIVLSGLGTQANGEWVAPLTAGQLVLAKDQTTSADKGLYVVAAGAWARTADASTGTEITNASVFVKNGATLAGDTFTQTATVVTIGTDPQTWVQTGEGGVYTVDGVTLQQIGLQFSIKDAGVSNAKLANMGALTVKGSIAGGVPADLTPAQITASMVNDATALLPGRLTAAGFTTLSNQSGTNTGDQTISITGDVTAAGSTGVLTATVTKIQGSPVDATPPTNGQVLQWVSASSKWIPFSYAGDVSGGPSAAIVIRLQGTPIASTVPQLGMTLSYGPTSWQPTRPEWNILNFGADPTAAADSSLAIYNAHICCGITAGAAYLVTTAGATTNHAATFAVSVTANAAFPSSDTGTLIAMTTRGLVYMTFSNGTTNSVTCQVTAGVSGGTILSGSIMGIVSTTQIGGTIYYPSGLWLVNNPIINSIPNVWEKGPAAAASNSDVGNWGYAGGAWLYYNGTLGDFVMTHVPISGTLGLQAGQNLKGIRITGLNFACSGTATGYGFANGLRLISCSGFHIEDLFVNEPAFVAYEFTTLGLAMLGEAEDTTRGTAINLRFRCLEKPGGATAAQVSAAATSITAGAGTNINTFAGAGTLTTAALTAAAWPTPGLAMVQAIDQLTGNVMDYMVSYTGVAGPGLTGVTTLPLWYNQADSTTLNAATPTSGNAKPSALLFAAAGSTPASLVRPAYAAYAMGIRLHGSATANTSVNTFIQLGGNHWMGAAAYLGNSDTNRFIGLVWNRTSAGTPTGKGWDVQGATAILGSAGTSRNNTWIGGDPGPGGATFRGTDSYGYTTAATPNYWTLYELGNGAPIPIQGTGCSLAWDGNGPFREGPLAARSTTLSAALTVNVFTLVPGTLAIIPPQGWQVGTHLRFRINLRKTAVGTSFDVAIRTNGTGAAGAGGTVLATLNYTGTAVVDQGYVEVDVIVTALSPTAGSATATIITRYELDHRLAATGLATGVTTPAGLAVVTPVGPVYSADVATKVAFDSFLPATTAPQFVFAEVRAVTAASVFNFEPGCAVDCIKAANP